MPDIDAIMTDDAESMPDPIFFDRRLVGGFCVVAADVDGKIEHVGIFHYKCAVFDPNDQILDKSAFQLLVKSQEIGDLCNYLANVDDDFNLCCKDDSFMDNVYN